MNKNEKLKQMKLQQISEMIKNNIEFGKFIKEKGNKLSRKQILEFLRGFNICKSCLNSNKTNSKIFIVWIRP